MTIPLGPGSRRGSSALPGPDAAPCGTENGGPPPWSQGVAPQPRRTLFGLAPDGVCRAGRLPDRWCALTAPFHPCHACLQREGLAVPAPDSVRRCLSVALSVPCGPRGYLASCPAVFGLSSVGFHHSGHVTIRRFRASEGTPSPPSDSRSLENVHLFPRCGTPDAPFSSWTCSSISSMVSGRPGVTERAPGAAKPQERLGGTSTRLQTGG